MLAGVLSWWVARMVELLPSVAARRPNGIVLDTDQTGQVTPFLRRNGREEPVSLGAAVRMAGRRTVLLRPPPDVVLEKHHSIPTAPRRDMDHLLGHELGRITPFPATALFWRWDGRSRPGDKTRTDVVLTMVPKMAVSAALEDLALAGLRPRFLEIGSRLLPLAETDADRASLMLRGLAWTCTGLAVVAVVLPFALQAWALHAANDAIADLQPSIRQVEALRRNITAGGAEREVLAREMARTGDVLDVLATVTHILPDDTFLTDFALRERHLTISGRSTSAPRLISGLTADTGIRDAAFAAPVTRIEGASADVFSISAQIAPTGTP